MIELEEVVVIEKGNKKDTSIVSSHEEHQEDETELEKLLKE